MKLTGNSLEQFEKWYKECYDKENLPYIQGFYASSFSIQYGVLIDFFDSVGIYVSNNHNIDLYCSKLDGAYYKIDYSNNEGMPTIVMNKFKTRPQARAKAIEMANEILNSRV